jgi:hypothetical protein
MLWPQPATIALRCDDMTDSKTHKVVRTEVWPTGRGKYGVLFVFDDGAEDAAEVGSKEAAEWYAKVQLGQDIVVGTDPLLLNAAKADALRGKG